MSAGTVSLVLLRGAGVVWGFFVFLIFIGIQLIYNIMLVSAVQQSESVLYTYTHIHTHTYTL